MISVAVSIATILFSHPSRNYPRSAVLYSYVYWGMNLRRSALPQGDYIEDDAERAKHAINWVRSNLKLDLCYIFYDFGFLQSFIVFSTFALIHVRTNISVNQTRFLVDLCLYGESRKVGLFKGFFGLLQATKKKRGYTRMCRRWELLSKAHVLNVVSRSSLSRTFRLQVFVAQSRPLAFH